MVDRAQRANQRPSLEELESFLKNMQSDRTTSGRPMTIPGYDSYMPSYLTGGADAGVRTDGKLESNTKRDKQIA